MWHEEDLVTANNIPALTVTTGTVDELQEGKATGMFKVLWECGWKDEACY
jgi:hypothetical protein